MGRLGCLSDLQVFVTDKCSAPRLCELTDITAASWNRKLDDVSEATITIGLTDPECCDCMSNIEPWCHMLHIIRNGEIVWQGVITQITYGYQQVAIQAQDILAFLKVKIPQFILDTRTLFPNGQEITDLARTVLIGGFSDIGGLGTQQNCFLNNIVQTDLIKDSAGKTQRPTLFKDTSVSPDNGFTAFDGTVFDWLQILAENGLDYTVIGLTIVLSVENANIHPLGVLTDEHIMGEIAVSKNGYLMANRVFVRYQGDDKAEDTTDNEGKTIPGCKSQCKTILNTGADCVGCGASGANGFPCLNVPCPAFAQDTDSVNSCYGPIERLFNNGEVGNYTTALQTAKAYVLAGSMAPRTVEFPSGTRLSPDTPWEINDMVPGQRIDVALTGICLDEFQSFRLLEVNYELSADSDEAISLSLGPMNAIGTI